MSETKDIGETPVEGMPFLVASREFTKLESLDSLTPEQEKRADALGARMYKLVGDIKAEGLLKDVYDGLDVLGEQFDVMKEMAESGELFYKQKLDFLRDIQDATAKASGMTEVEEESEHRGVKEFVYRQGLIGLRAQARLLKATPSSTQNTGAFGGAFGRAADAMEATARGMEKAAEVIGKASEKRLTGIGRMSEQEVNAKVQEALNDIEANDYQLGHTQNAQIAAELERAYSFMPKELAAQVKAELSLQEAHALIAAVSGGTVDLSRAIRGVVAELQARGHLMEGADFKALLSPETELGSRVSKAFTVLQRGAFDGRWMQSPEDTEQLLAEAAQAAGGGLEGRKAQKLALRIARVTFETSIWNKDVRGVDPLGEAVYMKTNREDKFGKGTDKGPAVTRNLIYGFGTSFFRYASTADGDHIFNNKDWKGIEALKSEPDKCIDELMRLQRIHDSKGNSGYELDFSKVDFSKMRLGSFAAYLGGYLPKILEVKDLVLRSDWKPLDVTKDVVVDWLAAFNTHADPTRQLRLKPLFVMGLLDEGLRQGLQLGWGQIETAGVVRRLTENTGFDPKTNQPVSFLPQESMQQVLGYLSVGKRGFVTDVIQALVGAIRLRK